MAAYGKILTIMFEMKFVVTRIRIKFKLIFSVCGLIPGVLLLSACGNGPWNNPYPESESAANIYYAPFTLRPKHLDPAQSYSSNEVAFTAQIYEPPLQYHFLKNLDIYLDVCSLFFHGII